MSLLIIIIGVYIGIGIGHLVALLYECWTDDETWAETFGPRFIDYVGPPVLLVIGWPLYWIYA